eukprot:gene26086-31499_t
MFKSKPSEQFVNASNRNLDDEEETMYDFIKEHVNKFYVTHIPVDSIQELPDTYMYYFGAVSYIFALVLFLYFLITNYDNATNQAFISLEKSSGDCNTVPIAVSGTYLADVNGNWQGQPGFDESEALYSLTFSNFEINSNSQYEQMMSIFYSNLEAVNDLSANFNLGFNLILWTTYLQYYSVQDPTARNFSQVGHGQLQTFGLTGDSTVVFELDHYRGAVGSAVGVCALVGFTSYDQSNGDISLTYENATNFIQDPVCFAALRPENAGYSAQYSANVFQLNLDVRSLTVALGVNYNIVPLSSLQRVSRNLGAFSYNSTNFTIGIYYDPKYSLMDGVVCIEQTLPTPSAIFPTQLCFYSLGSILAFPVLNHDGASQFKPEYCSCTGDPAVGKSSPCQLLNLLPGLIYFNININTTYIFISIMNAGAVSPTIQLELLQDLGLIDLLNLISMYNNSYTSLNAAAYNASFWVGLGSSASDQCDNSCISNAFEFCNIGNASCSLLIYGADSTTSQGISEQKYQLTNGSCNPAIAISPEAWSKLVTEPPVAFTQTYYECYQDSFSALLTAFGVASGNVQLFLPVCVLFALPLLYFSLMVVKQLPPKDEYVEREKAEVLETLAILLLRLRDGKTRGLRRGGVLQGLGVEMIKAAKEEGGYPDSDDEDEDETGSRKTKSLRGVEGERDSSLVSSPFHPSERSKGAASGTHNTGPRVGKRSRMAVMTKNLHQPSAPPPAPHANHSYIPAFMRSSTINPAAHVRESEMTTMQPRASGAGGWFGWGKPAPAPAPAAPTGVDVFPLLSQHPPSADIIILNSALASGAPNNRQSQHVPTTKEGEVLLSDLHRLLAECIGSSSSSTEGDAEQSSRRDLPTYYQARALSSRLALLDPAPYLTHMHDEGEGGGGWVLKLYNCICMHASIQLDLPLREVMADEGGWGKKVGYNVGGRLVTVHQLQELL